MGPGAQREGLMRINHWEVRTGADRGVRKSTGTLMTGDHTF